MRIDAKLKAELKKILKKKIKEEEAKVKIISAQKLSKDEWKILFDTFAFLRNAKAQESIDRNLLAGVIIQRGSQLIDLSLRGRFRSLKRDLYEFT